jgi:protein SCO1/2
LPEAAVDRARRRSAVPLWWSALAFLAFLAALAACSGGKPSFNSVDVTGAEFGRDFALTDHTGKARTLSDFKGKAVAVFFGFTQCPDVCPTTLAEMKEVRSRLGADADRLQVVFITIDPERDTPELLGKYVPAFDPSFIGLYGDADTTARTAKEFKVFFQKSQGTTPGSYSMDHTAATFIYDPQGRLRLFAKYGMGPDALAQDIKRLLAGE